MEKLYDYHFRAYRRVSKEFLGEFHWKQITPKEFNHRLARVYGHTRFVGSLRDSEIALNWL